MTHFVVHKIYLVTNKCKCSNISWGIMIFVQIAQRKHKQGTESVQLQTDEWFAASVS